MRKFWSEACASVYPHFGLLFAEQKLCTGWESAKLSIRRRSPALTGVIGLLNLAGELQLPGASSSDIDCLASGRLNR